MNLLTILMVINCLQTVFCWSQEELDLFDLVEDIGENFYDILQVPQDASPAEIRKAYRRLSLQYHPDKSDKPNAAETFTKIGAVVEVLRDDVKRQMYDAVLEHGLPDWKQPVYYYRRVRKMGLWELSILLLAVITIGQFLYGWAAYLEKQIVLYELREKKDKKERKSKGRKIHSPQLDAEVFYYEQMAKASLPHYSKLLPYVLVKKLYHFIRALGIILYHNWKLYQLKRKRTEKLKNEQEKSQPLVSKESEIFVDLKDKHKTDISSTSSKHGDGKTKLNTITSKEIKDEVDDTVAVSNKTKQDKPVKPVAKTGLSSEQNELKLINQVKKDKTEKKSKEKMHDLDDEDKVKPKAKTKKRVTFMEDSLQKELNEGKSYHDQSIKRQEDDKDQPFLTVKGTNDSVSMKDHINSHTNSNVAPTGIHSKMVVNGMDGLWSQYQQSQLEWALAQYSKDVHERWELIAKAVPGKSKNECQIRYKELVELVKQRKLYTQNS